MRVSLLKIKLAALGAILAICALIGTGQMTKVIRHQKKEITIGVFSDSYWGVQNGNAYVLIDEAIARFEEEHPGFRVNYTSGLMKQDYGEWMSEQFMQGKEPDLFFILGDDFNEFAKMDCLMDLGEFERADNAYDSSAFYQAAYEHGKNQGKQYALPFECAPRMMFVNKSMLEKENIKLPEKTWTWNAFYAICSQVTKDTDGDGLLDQFGEVGYTWEDAFYANGVQIFDQEGKSCNISGDAASEAIHFLERLRKLNTVIQPTERDFNLGNVAFMPMSYSEYRAYKSYPLSVKKYTGFEWECTTMPAGFSGGNYSELDVLLLGMSKQTAYPNQTWDLLKLLTTDEEIQSGIFRYSEGIPVLKNVTDASQAEEEMITGESGKSPMTETALREVMENAVVIPRFYGYEEAMEQVGNAVDAIISGNGNIEMELIIQNRKVNSYMAERNMASD